jgi:hypothetical protein
VEQAAIDERFAYYWAHRSQMNMGWVVELWPGWRVKWSGWNAQDPDGVWDASWTAVPVTPKSESVDATRTTVTVSAQAIKGQHEHSARMALCLSAFEILVFDIEKQNPNVGLEKQQ